MKLIASSKMRDPVFLHFFDVHFLVLKQADRYKKEVSREARLATRFAYLCADEILVPAASFVESGICRKVIGEFSGLFPYGAVWLVGGAANMEEFAFHKLRQYDPDSEQHKAYLSLDFKAMPPFRTRMRSSTQDIRTDWGDLLDAGSVPGRIAAGTQFVLPKDFERRWEQVPSALEEKAFIVPYVAPLLIDGNPHPTIENRLHYVINEAYFGSYVREFGARTVQDLIYLASPHPVPTAGPGIAYRELLRQARQRDILKTILSAKADRLDSLRQDERWVGCLLGSMDTGIQADQRQAHEYITPKENRAMQQLRSFIVHGHDEAAKLELKDYLQNTLGLPEPVILHQQPSRGRTVIEKFEECSEEIDVAFVLLTPDDVGGKDAGDIQQRVRQNVIFELGVFIGRLGRRSGRVLLLHKGDLEIPSDLAGVIYIDISSGITAAGEKIRKELVPLDVRT